MTSAIGLPPRRTATAAAPIGVVPPTPRFRATSTPLAPSKLDFELPQSLPIDFDTQARLAREGNLTVHNLQFVGDKLFAQKGIAQVGWEEFDVGAVRSYVGEVGEWGSPASWLETG